jgi:hypothetical protein
MNIKGTFEDAADAAHDAAHAIGRTTMEAMRQTNRMRLIIGLGIVLTLVAVNVGVSQATAEAILYKFLVGSAGLLFAHVARKQLFGRYIDFSEVVTGKTDKKEQTRMRLEIRIALIYGIFAFYIFVFWALLVAI